MIIRHKHNVFRLLFSWRGTILPKVLLPLSIFMLMSALIGGISAFGFLHFREPPLVGFTLIGVVLSIFLGFKNSTCYDRWWEARKLWGNLIANTRHIDRDCRILGSERREKILQQVIVFAQTLRDRLRQQTEHPIAPALAEYNSQPTEYSSRQANNAPQYALSQIQTLLQQALQQGEISDIIYCQLNQHIIELGEVQAGCDRIASTPLPFSYSVLLNRTVFFFCFMLPFSLGSTLGLATPALVGILAYTFLGLDALSAEIEDPFGIQSNDLPLDAMVRSIEIELLESLGKPVPPPIAIKNYNLL